MDLNFSQGKVFKSVTRKRVNDMQTGQIDVTCLDPLCMWGGCNKLARGCKTRGQGCFDLVEADKDYYVGILDVSYWSLCNDFEDYYSCSLWVSSNPSLQKPKFEPFEQCFNVEWLCRWKINNKGCT